MPLTVISSLDALCRQQACEDLAEAQPGSLVVLHKLAELKIRLPVVFIDTLHNFAETIEHVERVRDRYDLERVSLPAQLALIEELAAAPPAVAVSAARLAKQRR